MRSRRKGVFGRRLLGVSINWPSRGKHRALSTPPQAFFAFFPLKPSSVAKEGTLRITSGKSRDRKPRPRSPEPRKRRRGFGRRDVGSFVFFSSSRIQTEKTETLTCALVAEQSRTTSPASSESAVALDRMAIPGKAKRGERGGEEKKRSSSVGEK